MENLKVRKRESARKRERERERERETVREIWGSDVGGNNGIK